MITINLVFLLVLGLISPAKSSAMSNFPDAPLNDLYMNSREASLKVLHGCVHEKCREYKILGFILRIQSKFLTQKLAHTKTPNPLKFNL